MPDLTPASAAVRAEWQARIAAEYTSAAITQHLVLWMIQLGAPPDLLEAGLVIVGDELAHSRLSHDAYVAAGGAAPPALARARLGLSGAGDDVDVLRVVVQSFCLGETVAVPLFRHLREHCTVAPARAALDRILRDEVRHREFGWDCLDWLGQTSLAPRIPELVQAWLPAMLGELDASYGAGNPAFAPAEAMTAGDRAWGLAPAHEYAEILARTIERDYRPRFAARSIELGAAWPRPPASV